MRFYIIILTLLIAGSLIYFAEYLPFSNRVINQDQWFSALVGEWEVSMEYKSLKKNMVEKGEVVFNADSTFLWKTNRKEYGKEVNPDFVKCISGGYFKGKWKIDSSFIRLVKNEVKIKIDYFPVSEGSSEDEEKSSAPSPREKKQSYLNKAYQADWKFGNFSDLDRKCKVKKFTKNEIVFIFDYYVSGAKNIIKFKRK